MPLDLYKNDIDCENYFSEPVCTFISQKMKIDVYEYISKIKSDANANKEFFYDLTEVLLYEIEKSKPFDLCEKYDQILNKFAKTYGIIEDSKAYEIGDVLFRSFYKYMTGGIVALYVDAETDRWFPLPRFDKPIEEYRKDLTTMDNVLTIYRGTHIDEWRLGNIRQSWSIDPAIACKFAFRTYRDCEKDFDMKNRVILQAKIHIEDILLYLDDGLGSEKECIIDTGEIIGNSMCVFARYQIEYDDTVNNNYDCTGL